MSYQLTQLEELIVTESADQQRLDADVEALRQSFTSYQTSVKTALDELKAQISAGTPAPALNLGPLEALASDVEAGANAAATEATADVPPVFVDPAAQGAGSVSEDPPAATPATPAG